MQTPENGVKGRIHSFLSMGAVDGPGLRYVVFLQGCPLRCACCHNPDTWNAAGGTEYTVEDVLRRVRRCKPYIYESGGVTVTGGEPLAQPVFTAALLKALRATTRRWIPPARVLLPPRGRCWRIRTWCWRI